MTVKGFQAIAGADEAGRGPLAGPVVAGACIVPLDCGIQGIHDSKKLNREQLEALFEQLTTHPEIAWATCILDARRIDEINILAASMEAMAIAVPINSLFYVLKLESNLDKPLPNNFSE